MLGTHVAGRLADQLLVSGSFLSVVLDCRVPSLDNPDVKSEVVVGRSHLRAANAAGRDMHRDFRLIVNKPLSLRVFSDRIIRLVRQVFSLQLGLNSRVLRAISDV